MGKVSEDMYLKKIYRWSISTSKDAWYRSLFSSVQLLSRVRLFATPWTTACQASLSITQLVSARGSTKSWFSLGFLFPPWCYLPSIPGRKQSTVQVLKRNPVHKLGFPVAFYNPWFDCQARDKKTRSKKRPKVENNFFFLKKEWIYVYV